MSMLRAVKRAVNTGREAGLGDCDLVLPADFFEELRAELVIQGHAVAGDKLHVMTANGPTLVMRRETTDG